MKTNRVNEKSNDSNRSSCVVVRPLQSFNMIDILRLKFTLRLKTLYMKNNKYITRRNYCKYSVNLQ